MPFLKWTIAGALVAVLSAGSGAQSSLPYQVEMPYEVLPDHFKPNFPEGWTWGAVIGVYAESPDRIYVYQWGILPTVSPFVGSNGMPARDAVRERKDERREYILMVFDGQGNRIEHWKHLDAMHQGKNTPHRIRVNQWDPDRHIWLIDEGEEGQLLKLTRTGKLVLRLGSETTGCRRPQDIAFTPNGDFWCLEGLGHARVIKFSQDGKQLAEFGGPGSGPGQFKNPHAITTDGRGRIYIADRDNGRIQIFDSNGKLLETWPEIHAMMFAIDKNDRLWAWCGTDTCGAGKPPQGMTALDVNSGKVLFTWGEAGGLSGQFYGGSQFDVDRAGNLFTVETRGGRLQKFRPKKGANSNYLVAWPLDVHKN